MQSKRCQYKSAYNGLQCTRVEGHDGLHYIEGIHVDDVEQAAVSASPQPRPTCDYTGCPCLDLTQLCRCDTCQTYAARLFAPAPAQEPPKEFKYGGCFTFMSWLENHIHMFPYQVNQVRDAYEAFSRASRPSEPSAPKVEPQYTQHTPECSYWKTNVCDCRTRTEQAETASAPLLDTKTFLSPLTQLACAISQLSNDQYRKKEIICIADAEKLITGYLGKNVGRAAAPSVAGTQPPLRHRIADLLKIASSSEGGPSEDAVFDYVKALHGAAQGTPQVEEIAREIVKAFANRYGNVGVGHVDIDMVSAILRSHLVGAPTSKS
jgi:hypothetical protein